MASAGIVPRTRLERLLAGAWERRITLIVAGGGYGKTTALRALYAGGPVHWLTLTAADREVEALFAHITGTFGFGRGHGGAGATPAIGAADRRGLAEGQAAAICEGLDRIDGPLMLVLDESDHLHDEDSATQMLRALCLQASSRLHVVLSGRRLPALGLGAAGGRGELLELTAPDLAFTADETAALLVARLGPQAETLAAKCWALTTGWAAALQLIADRLERVESRRWRETLDELEHRRGRLWRDFARDLVEREPSSAREALAIASVVTVVDDELLDGLGVTCGHEELDSLQSRGLLVAGERGGRTLSPVLAEVVAERLRDPEAGELRHRASGWLERAGRLEEALECAVAGPRGETLALLRRCGGTLVAGGYGSRVAEVLRELGTEGDLELDTVRGAALVALGDWDGAMDLFRAMERRTSGAPLQAATAWRFGALLYLRGELEAGREVLSAAYQDGPGTSDDALVSAWLSAALWGLGETDETERTATVALRQAQASGDDAARAAAHVALALAAANRGDRGRNERHHKLALRAALEAGDSVQLARCHANLSSKAVEDGDYARAVEEADEAIRAGAGHNVFSAIAMCNKAEALMHTGELEEARALLVQAIDSFSSLGSLLACAPITLLGLLDAERGDFARARVSLERAQRLAEQAGDVHSLVLALCGLASTLAQDDPEQARRHASTAAGRATSLERAQSLCAWSWVELCAGDRARAASLAAEAEAEARRNDDRPSIARALELRGATHEPPDEALLEAAAELWHEVGDPIAARRTELILAFYRGDAGAAARRRDELATLGAQPEIGLTGLLLARRGNTPLVVITTLGRFSVQRSGQPVPLAAWQSRKARDLLKLLASRRGRHITREAAGEALWPNEQPRLVSNRLSVALSTLRKVLDPDRVHPPHHFVAADNQSLALRIEHATLDVITFLDAADAGVALASRGDWLAAQDRLRDAANLYTGDFLEEDLYEDWAVDCREEARSAALEVSRLLARAAALRKDDEGATRHLRRLLERDPYDADAWTALMGAQLRLRRYGEARRQHTVYARRMAELAIPAVPLARTLESQP